MSKRIAVSMVTVIGVIFLMFSTLEKPVAHAQVTTFMKSPYFGKEAVSVVFDHQLPIYDSEDPGFKNSVMHHDGEVWLLSEEDQKICVGYSGHNGIDYTLIYDYVLATHDGQIIAAGWQDPQNRDSGLGLRIEVQTTNNSGIGSTYITRYGHLSTLLVQTNQVVEQGKVIAISGNTGKSTGPHLHFEVRKQTGQGSVAVNPYGWEDSDPDPWQGESGVASVNLWQDPPSINKYSTCDEFMYASGDPLPPSNDPPLEPDFTHPVHLVIDDLSPWFKMSGSSWTQESCNDQPECYGTSYRFTPFTSGSKSAKWAPYNHELLAAQYDIYAYIPHEYADTGLALYKIYHNNKADIAAIDQSRFNQGTYTRTWAYLGRYDFSDGLNTNQPQQIMVGHEGNSNQYLAADAVAFVLAERPPDIDVPITQGNDDASRHPHPAACTFNVGTSEIYLGYCNNGTANVSGFRYSNIAIPDDATIARAHLLFTVDGPYDEELDLDFYGELNPESPPFSESNRPEHRSPLTSASLSWYLPTAEDWVFFTHRYSPNLAPIVQEIVDHDDWEQGDSALTFIVQPAPGFSGNEFRRVMAYERNQSEGEYSARLLVWYSCPSGPPCPQQ